MRKTIVTLIMTALVIGSPVGAHQVMDGYRTQIKVKGHTFGKPKSAMRFIRRFVHRAIHRGQGKAVIRIQSGRTPILFSGNASWYGDELAGNGTACGEIFDPNKLTAAHRTLPCGTRLVISHGSRDVTVRVNDRGPFIEDRVIDLSRAAFERIASLGAGVVFVEARKP